MSQTLYGSKRSAKSAAKGIRKRGGRAHVEKRYIVEGGNRRRRR